MKRIITITFLLIAMAITSMVGTLAIYFDRDQTQVSASAGNVRIDVDTTNFLIDINDSGGTPEYIPNDAIPLEWEVINKGSKSAVVRQTLIFSLFDTDGNPLSFSSSPREISLYPELSDGSMGSNEYDVEFGDNNETIAYTFEDVLNGNSSFAEYQNEGFDESVIHKTIALYETLENPTDPKDKIVIIDLIVEAKQYRNTESVRWETIQSNSITLGNGTVVDVTPRN